MTSRIIIVFIVITVAVAADAEEPRVTPEIPVANGSMTVIRKGQTTPTAILIHFHGSAESIEAAFARCKLNVVLVGCRREQDIRAVSLGSAHSVCQHNGHRELSAAFPEDCSQIRHVDTDGDVSPDEWRLLRSVLCPWIRRDVRTAPHAAPAQY